MMIQGPLRLLALCLAFSVRIEAEGFLWDWFLRYHVTFDYSNVPLLDRWMYFDYSGLRWARVITGDVPDIKQDLSKYGTTDCGSYPNEIDDLYVCVSYKNIETPGVLAVGYPTLYRGESYLPLAGVMQFDKDGIAVLKKHDIFLANVVSGETFYVFLVFDPFGTSN